MSETEKGAQCFMSKKIISLLMVLALALSFVVSGQNENVVIEDDVIVKMDSSDIVEPEIFGTQSNGFPYINSVDLPDYYKDPNVMSDESFFGSFTGDDWDVIGKIDYSVPGLSAVESHVKAGRYKEAKEAYFEFNTNKFKNYNKAFRGTGSTSQYLQYQMIKHNFMWSGFDPVALYTVDNEWGWVREDITSLVKVGDTLKAVMLVALEKDNSVIEIRSLEGDPLFVPYIEAVVNEKNVRIPANMDANISAGTNAAKYSQELTQNAPDILKVAESASSIGRVLEPVDENTFRTYLQFDLSILKEGDEVSKATLNLYARNAGGTGKKEMLLSSAGEVGWSDSSMRWTAGAIQHYVYSFDGEEYPSWYLNDAVNHYYRVEEDPIRFGWFHSIIGYYQTSGNPEVMYELSRMLISYIKTRPNPANVKTLDGACRGIYIPEALSELANSGAITADVFVGVIKYLWTQAEYLYDVRNFNPESNWGIYQTMGLFTTALYFAELFDSPRWLDKAYERLEILVKGISFSDGTSKEVALGYAQPSIKLIFNDFVDIYARTGADSSKIPFTDDYYKWLGIQTKYIMDMSAPGFYDHNQGNSSSVASYRAFLRQKGNELNFSNALWAGTNGLQGDIPNYTSVLYPVGGKVAMRSDWSEKALYLHMNNDRARKSHGHIDDLSVVVFAHGKNLIVDPGYYTQAENPIRYWLLYTRAHNTVTVNDTHQSRDEENPLPGVISDWETNNGFDYINMETPGWSSANHTRGVLFVKNKFWIVTDLLEPYSKAAPTRYEQFWHFLPEANVKMNEDTMILETTGFSDVNIKIIPVETDDYTAVKNDTNLLGDIDKPEFHNNSGIKTGYYSPTQSVVYKAGYASYLKADIVGDTTFNTVLFPMAAAVEYDVDVCSVDRSLQPDKEAAFRIDYTKKGANSTTTGIYSNLLDKTLAGSRTIGNITTNGKMSYAEYNKGGWLSLNFMGGTFVKDKDKDVELMRSKSEIDSISVNWQSSSIYIDSMNDLALQDLTIFTNGRTINRVFLNGTAPGNSIPFKQQGRYVYFGSTPIIEDNAAVITPPLVTSDKPSNTHASGGGAVSEIPAVKPENSGKEDYTEAPVVSPVNVFTDTDNHWAVNEILKMHEYGVVTGDGAGRFLPDDSVTRAEFAAMLLRLLKINIEINSFKGIFADVAEDAWYSKVVETAFHMGIVNGYNDGSFRPNAQITRQEMAVMLLAVCEILDIEFDIPADITEYSDYYEITDWAAEAVRNVVGLGLMNGFSDKTFLPQGEATRAQGAVVMSRLLVIR